MSSPTSRSPAPVSAPDVRAYVAKPEGEGPFPTVIMIHEFWGLNQSIVSKADLLAEEGYFVIAPDTFRGSTTGWVPRAIYQVISSRPENINADLDSVYAWLESQPDVDTVELPSRGFATAGGRHLPIACITTSLPRRSCFMALPKPIPEILKTLPGPVLGIFGGRTIDPCRTGQCLRRGIDRSRRPHEITIYEGQPHAFVQDAEGIQAGGAQGEAWNQMLAFLEANLKNKSTPQCRMLTRPWLSVAPFCWKYYVDARLRARIRFGKSCTTRATESKALRVFNSKAFLNKISNMPCVRRWTVMSGSALPSRQSRKCMRQASLIIGSIAHIDGEDFLARLAVFCVVRIPLRLSPSWKLESQAAFRAIKPRLIRRFPMDSRTAHSNRVNPGIEFQPCSAMLFNIANVTTCSHCVDRYG